MLFFFQMQLLFIGFVSSWKPGCKVRSSFQTKLACEVEVVEVRAERKRRKDNGPLRLPNDQKGKRIGIEPLGKTFSKMVSSKFSWNTKVEYHSQLSTWHQIAHKKAQAWEDKTACDEKSTLATTACL